MRCIILWFSLTVVFSHSLGCSLLVGNYEPKDGGEQDGVSQDGACTGGQCACVDGRARCNGICCDKNQQCDDSSHCCPNKVCDGTCCPAGQVCNTSGNLPVCCIPNSYTICEENTVTGVLGIYRYDSCNNRDPDPIVTCTNGCDNVLNLCNCISNSTPDNDPPCNNNHTIPDPCCQLVESGMTKACAYPSCYQAHTTCDSSLIPTGCNDAVCGPPLLMSSQCTSVILSCGTCAAGQDCCKGKCIQIGAQCP